MEDLWTPASKFRVSVGSFEYNGIQAMHYDSRKMKRYLLESMLWSRGMSGPLRYKKFIRKGERHIIKHYCHRHPCIHTESRSSITDLQ